MSMSVYTSYPPSRKGIGLEAQYPLNQTISSLDLGLNHTDWV